MTYRIGVDARLLTQTITGIGRYSHEMLRRLIETEHEWFLYAPTPITVGDWRRANVTVRESRFTGRALRLVWAGSVLPRQAAQDRLDLFWSPTHRLPRFMPADIATVVTVHDLVWKHAGETMPAINRWLDARLLPQAARLADRIITVSQNTADDLIAEVPEAAGKVDVIPLGVAQPEPIADSAVLTGFNLDDPFLLFVGTLEPRKNLRRLMEAYSRLTDQQQSDARLVIVGGSGWGGVDARSLAAEFGVTERTDLLGYVTEPQLAALYEKALFLAMPSLYEGFGLPLLEAMIRGTPVLTSNRASMPEVAGDAGLLIEPDDVEAIRSGLERMLTDAPLRERLAGLARDRAKAFTWDSTVSETLKVFDQAVALRRRGQK